MRAAPRRGLGPAAPAARSPPARGPILRAAGGGTAPAVWGSVSGGDHGDGRIVVTVLGSQSHQLE